VPRGRGVQVGTTFGEGPPPKIWKGKKHLKFFAISDCYQLRSRISPERIHISKIGKVVDQLQPLPRWLKKDGELWSRKKLYPPKLHYSTDYISALKFLHTLEIDQGLLACTQGSLTLLCPIFLVLQITTVLQKRAFIKRMVFCDCY